MSIKTPKMRNLILNAGVSEEEINQMSVDEFKNIIVALASEHGNTFEEIQRKLEPEARNFSNESMSVPFPMNGTQQLIIPPLENPENQNVEEQEIGEETSILPKITTSPINKLKNINEIAELRGFKDGGALIEYRKKLIHGLAIPENKRYQDELMNYIKNMTREPPDGANVTLLLHDGIKINRVFSEETLAKDIYYYAANQPTMIQDHIKLGTFIITDLDGNEIDPNSSVGSTIHTKYSLLFVRLAY